MSPGPVSAPERGRRPHDLLGTAVRPAGDHADHPDRGRADPPPGQHPAAWTAFGYLTAVSAFLGFFAWYAGLARGGIARVGQVQLIQPVLTLIWSALLLGETVTPAALLAALVVLTCVALTQRAR